jgi:hypothetical protein
MLINITEATLRMELSWAVMRNDSSSAAAALSWCAAARARALSMRAWVAALVSALADSAVPFWACTVDTPTALIRINVERRMLIGWGLLRKLIETFTKPTPKIKGELTSPLNS